MNNEVTITESWNRNHSYYLDILAGVSDCEAPTWNEMVESFSENKVTQEWFRVGLQAKATRQFAIRIIQSSTIGLNKRLLDAVLAGVLTKENDVGGPPMFGFRRACLEVAVACLGSDVAIRQLRANHGLDGCSFRQAVIALAINLPSSKFLRGKHC